MKRASYREAVAWIADNDEPLDLDVHSIAGYISTCLIADLFSLSPRRVADDIYWTRERRRSATRS